MNAITNVRLSFSCEEDWNTFKVVPGGRLCDKCAFVVHDFTNSTAEELREVMNNPGRVCGKFRRQQLATGIARRAGVLTAAVSAMVACTPLKVDPKPDITPGQETEILEVVRDFEILEEGEIVTVGVIMMVDESEEELKLDSLQRTD